MSGSLNNSLDLKCAECGGDVPFSTRDVCWNDPNIPDHERTCCDCFDTGLGARPKVKLNVPTSADWFRYEEYD